MKTFKFATDSESGQIEANDLRSAIERVSPTETQIEDGAWAWVEDPETGEREYVARENMS